ncbi:MAG TPA: hypothetical protein VGJ40_01130 [Gaiellaceae bacterium]
MRLIEDWLPEFDVGERHDAAVAAPPERALDLALAAPVAPDRFVGALLAARGMAGRGRTIESFLRALEFEHLGRTPTEWVAVLDRSRLKIAISFEAEPIPGGSRLTTETRVKVLDDRALRAFRLYWLAVGPFSALIRRHWLRAIQAAARP